MLRPYSRVLVVDDSETARKIMRAFVYKLGSAFVREASDGGMALTMLETQSFDLIISDWEMKPVDGLRLLQAVRHSPRWRNLPFIMVTGATKQHKYADIARDNGATFFLPKPFTIEALGQRIKALDVGGRAAA